MIEKILKVLGVVEIILGSLVFLIMGAIASLIKISQGIITPSPQFMITLFIFLGLLIFGFINIWISKGKINKIIGTGFIIELIGICSAFLFFIILDLIIHTNEFFPQGILFAGMISLPITLIGFIIKLVGKFIARR